MIRKFLPALLALGLATLSFTSHPARAQAKPVLTVLHRFSSPYGSGLFAKLTLGQDGNFYGVTPFGDTGNGTIYKVSPTGAFTTLFAFDNRNGRVPEAALAPAPDGSFYGTTVGGGYDGKGNPANGTVFKITPDGSLTTLYKFGGAAHGIYPYSLMRASDGNFYGVTFYGGAASSGGLGTVFRITPGGVLTVVHSFNFTEGALPQGRLLQGPDGALYGTTQDGGPFHKGTIFRMALDGTFRVLHNFDNAHGEQPFAGLTLGPDGNFYGTTPEGGHQANGTAFRITPGGDFTLLHVFKNSETLGGVPTGELVLGPDGNFYGTTESGSDSHGTVFRMTPAGVITSLYKFHTAYDGNLPAAGVVFGPDGALYGTTYSGGANNAGTIYKLTLPQ